MTDLPPLPRLPRSQWFPRELRIPVDRLRHPEIVMLRRLVGAHLTEVPVDVVMSMRFSRARRIFARDRAIGATTWRTLAATCWHRHWSEVVSPAWASIPSRIAFADLVASLGPAASRPARACFVWLRDELPRYRCHDVISRLMIALMRAVVANSRMDTAIAVMERISDWSIQSRSVTEYGCDVIDSVVHQIRRRFRDGERERLLHRLARIADGDPDPRRHLAADAVLFDLGYDGPSSIRHARRLVTGCVTEDATCIRNHPCPEIHLFRWVNRLSWAKRYSAFRDATVMAGMMSLTMSGRLPGTRGEPDTFVSNQERDEIMAKSARIIGKAAAALEVP
jgi:hypothetical protein